MSPEFLHFNADFCSVAAVLASREQGLGPVIPSACKYQLQRKRSPKKPSKK